MTPVGFSLKRFQLKNENVYELKDDIGGFHLKSAHFIVYKFYILFFLVCHGKNLRTE
jgi:hypothetical protein